MSKCREREEYALSPQCSFCVEKHFVYFSALFFALVLYATYHYELSNILRVLSTLVLNDNTHWSHYQVKAFVFLCHCVFSWRRKEAATSEKFYWKFISQNINTGWHFGSFQKVARTQEYPTCELNEPCLSVIMTVQHLSFCCHLWFYATKQRSPMPAQGSWTWGLHFILCCV